MHCATNQRNQANTAHKEISRTFHRNAASAMIRCPRARAHHVCTRQCLENHKNHNTQASNRTQAIDKSSRITECRNTTHNELHNQRTFHRKAASAMIRCPRAGAHHDHTRQSLPISTFIWCYCCCVVVQTYEQNQNQPKYLATGNCRQLVLAHAS
jgi:hypothetical protein